MRTDSSEYAATPINFVRVDHFIPEKKLGRGGPEPDGVVSMSTCVKNKVLETFVEFEGGCHLPSTAMCTKRNPIIPTK